MLDLPPAGRLLLATPGLTGLLHFDRRQQGPLLVVEAGLPWIGQGPASAGGVEIEILGAGPADGHSLAPAVGRKHRGRFPRGCRAPPRWSWSAPLPRPADGQVVEPDGEAIAAAHRG